jgi:hypothetical protein
MKTWTVIARDEYALTINRMTNRQRNRWARAGYPGQDGRVVDALYAFVPPPKVDRPKRRARKARAI